MGWGETSLPHVLLVQMIYLSFCPERSRKDVSFGGLGGGPWDWGKHSKLQVYFWEAGF